MELPNLPAPSWRGRLPLPRGKALAWGWPQAPQRKVTHPSPVRSQKPGWLLWRCSGDSIPCRHQPAVPPSPQLLRWAEVGGQTPQEPGLSLALAAVTTWTPTILRRECFLRHFAGVFLVPVHDPFALSRPGCDAQLCHQLPHTNPPPTQPRATKQTKVLH